jgi:hypothetical protein
MITVEEISAWAPAEILEEIRKAVPDATVTHQQSEEGFWETCVQQLDSTGAPVVLVEDQSIDERLGLLNAFGAIWFSQLPSPPPDSPWVRRSEVTRVVVPAQARAGGTPSPDPEDLDPQQIQEIYRSHESK